MAVFFGAWYLRKLKRRVTKLEAQKALFEEKKADAELKAKLEKDEQEASRLHEEAKKLTAVASNKEKEYNEEKKEHDRIKKAIDNATTWRELEKLTKEEK